MWPRKMENKQVDKSIILPVVLVLLYSVLALWPWLIHSSIGWSKLFPEWCLLGVLKATFLCVCKFFYCFYTWVTVCLGKTCFESNFLSLRSFFDWCFWTMVLWKTLESPLDCREIQPVHPKGNQSWIFTGRTDAEAETPILWPPDVKSWLIWKDPDAVKDWGQEEKGMTEDEMVGWDHQLNGHDFE